MDQIELTVEMGKSAGALLDDTAYKEALAQVKQEAMELFQNSGVSDTEKRESAYFMLQAVDKLDSRLKTMVFNGRMEDEKAKKRNRITKV